MNNEETRKIDAKYPPRRIDIAYNGAPEEYEDIADYWPLLKGGRIA